MTRRVKLNGGQEILLTDTVGFVQRLPTTLVAAFRATLEEVAEADLLIHVIDAANPSVHHQIEAVEHVLEEIGAGGRPMIVAFNKADRLPRDLPVVMSTHQANEAPDNAPLQLGGLTDTLPSVRVSAMTGDGIEELLRCISDNLILQFVQLDVLIPYDRGELVARFHQFGTITEESYEASGTHLCGYMPENQAGQLLSFQRGEQGALYR
jgi:GTP-binding protein HflX